MGRRHGLGRDVNIREQGPPVRAGGPCYTSAALLLTDLVSVAARVVVVHQSQFLEVGFSDHSAMLYSDKYGYGDCQQRLTPAGDLVVNTQLIV